MNAKNKVSFSLRLECARNDAIFALRQSQAQISFTPILPSRSFGNGFMTSVVAPV